jgi:hypothetical protein
VHILTRGRVETLTISRAYGVTLSSATAYDPTTGDSAGLTITPANDATSASVTTAASRGDVTLYATGLTVGKTYQLITAAGRETLITVEAYATPAATISTRLPWDVSVGSLIKGITSTASFTIPSTYTSRSILIEYTLSDATVMREEALVGSRRLMTPVTSADLLTRYPRLRDRKQGEVGFDNQISDVLAKARATFWQAGHVLDDCPTPAVMRDYLIAEITLQLLDAGYDVQASGDRMESRREMERVRDQEFSRLLNASNLWIDASEDRRKTDDETGPQGGITMSWRRQ